MATRMMRRGGAASVLVMACGVYVMSGGGSASDQAIDDPRDRRYCSGTAKAAFEACWNQREPDYWLAVGVCINIADEEEREECFDDAQDSRREDAQLCHQQLTARQSVCAAVGEDRYDPDFDPALFEDDFKRLRNPNRYFPLGIGYRWDYRGGGESITVTVLDKTKLIEGVTCVVVNDKVARNGDVVEETDDWFAQAKDGDVYYCGEEVKDFETFEGDRPKQPELVSIDGSFKVGREGDKPGIIFPVSPTRGEVYRQEFSLGNAEDVAEVLSTAYAFGREPLLDQFVPQRLAAILCSGDCVVTKDFTPHEPGVVERKYYAPGVGLFLEVNPGTGSTVQLVNCNFDSRCAMLAGR